MRHALAMAVGVALTAACGASGSGHGPWPGGDALLHDAVLENHSAAAWTQRPDFRERVAKNIADASSYWGVPPSLVAGWRVVIEDGLVDCGGQLAMACTDTGEWTITISATDSDHGALPLRCVESSALWHEIGHVAIGDGGHTDPRWSTYAIFAPYWNRIHAAAPADDEPCRGDALPPQF